MTTTPTIWKAEFFPNFANPAGNQGVPQTIGLANGDILVVWEDDTNGPSPGVDIFGRLFTPEGGPASAGFQVNRTITSSDETGPKLVALPDGGFVMAYGSFDASGGFITVERYDSNLQSVSSRLITDPRSSLTDWEVTADSVGNYTVVFELSTDDTLHTGDAHNSINVHAITYDHLTNVPGPEQIGTARNLRDDDDRLAGVSSFASGHIVTLTKEPDYDFFGDEEDTAEFTITDPLTGNRLVQPTRIAGISSVTSGHHSAIPLDVAALQGGQFVMLYIYWEESSYSLMMRIGSSEAPGSAIGPPIRIAPGFTEGDVVALRDGGFFVQWAAGGFQRHGQRFDANGAKIGDELTFATDAFFVSNLHMSLTADGRILIPYLNQNHEISEVILDPRDNIIHGTAAGEVITTQIDSTQLFGEGGNDRLLGELGDDTLDGARASTRWPAAAATTPTSYRMSTGPTQIF